MSEPIYPQVIPSVVPDGLVLVHNHAFTRNLRPARWQGARGFRYWFQKPDATLERCSCEWAPELPEHYRPRGSFDQGV
jgi:hypothetical protein